MSAPQSHIAYSQHIRIVSLNEPSIDAARQPAMVEFAAMATARSGGPPAGTDTCMSPSAAIVRRSGRIADTRHAGRCQQRLAQGAGAAWLAFNGVFVKYSCHWGTAAALKLLDNLLKLRHYVKGWIAAGPAIRYRFGLE